MMEFLNNVWVALSTPNEGLVKILLLPLSIIEMSLSLYLIINVFNLKTTKKQNFLYIGTTIALGIISMYCLTNPLNYIFNYITSFIVIYIIFN